MIPKIDEYLSNLEKWQEELKALRMIILDCGLIEEVKWGGPCYTFNSKNVLIIGGFKDSCVISFIKGALLSDTEKVLTKLGENSQSARFIRFTSVKEILDLKPTIKAYIFEAIEIEKAGLKVEFKSNIALEFPKELLQKFEENAAFKTAFEALTPGRQRAYNMFFSDSKQSKTREARIEKYRQRIMNVKGMNDCTCGLSKKMPSCDGSHKFISQ